MIRALTCRSTVPANATKRFFFQGNAIVWLADAVHFTDLVQKQGSVLSQLNKALLACLGIGERTLFMPEQLALQQIFRDAAQLTSAKACSWRSLSRCKAPATSSLPVPLSPVTSTALSPAFATRRIRSKTLPIAGHCPTMPSRPLALSRRSAQKGYCSSFSFCCSRALLTSRVISSSSKGLLT